jgi:hypothetical protein
MICNKRNLRKLALELNVMKQGLIFDAWDCGIDEPKNKNEFYLDIMNKVILELNDWSMQVKE